jgi:hypothetical protein
MAVRLSLQVRMSVIGTERHLLRRGDSVDFGAEADIGRRLTGGHFLPTENISIL